ncbi:U-box domain-containing protein [Thalictrum thalictroides]|uniref:U-box domain-containing protein n=1 Tax=Thalictrum thalictroides TaxID=46969 RepID=A0A7J6WZB6_THATH|nr:U-box domain-containing protein [Thalictrum thalictroides]
MARYHHHRHHQIGSLVLDRRHHTGGRRVGGDTNHHQHFKLWSAFSGAAFRRKLFDTIGCGVSRQQDNDTNEDEDEVVEEEEEEEKKRSESSSNKLSEILKYSQTSEEEESETIKKKLQVLEDLQGVVKRLQSSENEQQVMSAALDVRRLAKDDLEARNTLAMLGAIPPLVTMLDLNPICFDSVIASLYALLNLSIGNDLNKAAIVKAGAVHKMLKLVDPNEVNSSPSLICEEAVVANFLALSALDSNKPIIAASGAIPFLVTTLQNLDKKDISRFKAKRDDCLRAIYNLSILPSNISFILETDLVAFLLNMLGDMEVSERILSILSNVVSTPQGRKTITILTDAFPILIDALNWTDSPSCQEKASYILMVMAHKAGYGGRQVMVEAGIVSSLLELTLLGSTLAQKRASRILESLSVDKGKQIRENVYQGGLGGGGGAVSAPICGSSSSTNRPNQDQEEEEQDEDDMMSDERKAVKQLVQLSLQNNMTRIAKRANLPQDFVPSEHFKSLTATSTSKSLPF